LEKHIKGEENKACGGIRGKRKNHADGDRFRGGGICYTGGTLQKRSVRVRGVEKAWNSTKCERVGGDLDGTIMHLASRIKDDGGGGCRRQLGISVWMRQ